MSLWKPPQTQSAEDRAATELLVAVARNYVTGADGTLPLPSGADAWAAALQRAESDGMIPLLKRAVSALPPGSVEPGVMEALGDKVRARVIKSLRCEVEVRECLESLNAHGIEPIIMKGVATAAALYDDPSLRPYDDLDLLITPEQWPEARRAILDAGGRPLARDIESLPARLDEGDMFDHWLEYRSRRGLLVEFALDPLQLGMRTRAIRSFFDRALPMSALGARASRLAPEHELVALCVHLNRHGFSRLIWWVDIGRLLAKYGSILRWDTIERLTRLEGLESPVYHTLLRVRAALGAGVSSDALEALRPPWFRRRAWTREWPDAAATAGTGAHEGPLVFRRSRNGLTLRQLASLDLRNVVLTGRGLEKATAIWMKAFPPKAFLREKYGAGGASYGRLWSRRARRRIAWKRRDEVTQQPSRLVARDLGHK